MAAAYPDAASEPHCEGPCGPSLAFWRPGASRRRPRTWRSRRSTHPRSRSQTGAGPLRPSSFGRSAIARYGPIQACAATASRQEQRLARTERRSRDGRTAEHGERGSARPLTSAVRQSMPAAVVLSRLVRGGRAARGDRDAWLHIQSESAVEDRDECHFSRDAGRAARPRCGAVGWRPSRLTGVLGSVRRDGGRTRRG